jgi:peptidoglycan hydrolase-like protein with peptidoglycan-binding domain
MIAAALTVLLLAPAAPAPDVLRLQVLLDRAHFSPGEIDGREGSNTERATRAFQRTHGLEETGRPTEETWAALGRDTAPVLASHAITAADAAGPFTQVPEDMMEKAKLPRLDYASPARGRRRGSTRAPTSSGS